jgi:hypothetical protein
MAGRQRLPGGPGQRGGYWHHQHREKPHHAVRDERFQNELLDHLAGVTGERLR